MYLADYRDEMFRRAFGLFMSGELTAAQEGEFRGRYFSLDEIDRLQWEHILQFYEPTQEGEADGR